MPVKNDPSALADILRPSAPSLPREINEGASGDGAGAAVDDLGCFGWVNSLHERAEVLELRLKSGVVAALPYGWIDFAEFDPSQGITLHARGGKVTIRGRNLNHATGSRIGLFRGIIHRRVAWIRETDRGEELAAGESATVVEAIGW